MREVIIGIVAGLVVMNTAAADTKKNVEPKADELLRKMSAELAGTKAFQYDADHVLEVVTKEGEKLQFVAKSRVMVQRPNKVRSDRLGAIADTSLYYDGKEITVYGKRQKVFARTPAPEKLDDAIEFAREKLGLEAPAADLFSPNAYDLLMEDVVSGRYVGDEPVGDRLCHHLAYRGSETDWQIWVADGPHALPCRFVITSKKVKGTPEFEVAFSNWNLSPTFDDSTFTFTAPKDARKIEFLGLAEVAKQRRQP